MTNLPSAREPARADLLPADGIAPARLHAAFVAAFADYVAGPFRVSLEAWPDVLARQGVDLALSRAVLDAAGTVQAFALVAVRRESPRWRLATMGALPTARGGGAARGLLADLIVRAGAAGCSALELEVFAQNPRALALYRRHGFEARHALHGYRWGGAGVADAVAGGTPAPPARPVPDGGPREVGRAEALAWLAHAAARLPELPLQVTAQGLAAWPAWSAWQRGAAQLVFGQSAAGETVRVHSLVDPEPGQRDAEAMLRALQAKYASSVIDVPQLQRPDLGGEALQRCGFAVLPLHQLWMYRPIAPVPTA